MKHTFTRKSAKQKTAHERVKKSSDEKRNRDDTVILQMFIYGLAISNIVTRIERKDTYD